MAGYTRQNDTGNKAVIVFAAFSLSADFNMIGEIPLEGSSIEDSGIGNDGFKSYIPGDLVDPGKQDAELNFNTRTALPPLHIPGLITITYPLRTGETAPATYIGTGFLYKSSLPQLKNGVLQTNKIGIQWDGKLTLPAFTPATSV